MASFWTSKAEVASSNNKIFGYFIIALAIAILCFQLSIYQTTKEIDLLNTFYPPEI